MITTKTTDPVNTIYEQDLEHIFYSFCTYVTQVHNQKINMAKIFIHVLEDDNLREIFKELGDHSTKYDTIRTFLTLEPSLQKSKYIKRYINQKNS